MNTLQAITNAIREWLSALVAKRWDDQIQSHSEAGLLDDLREEAREDLEDGRTTEL